MQLTYLPMIILQFQLRKSVEHGGMTKINSRISHDQFYLASAIKSLHTITGNILDSQFQDKIVILVGICWVLIGNFQNW